MDVAGLMTSLKSAETMGRIQVAVAKKVMDTQKMEGAAALQLLQSASQNTSRAGDALAAAATGLGGSLDTYG